MLQLYRLEEAGAIVLSTDSKEQHRLRRETAQMIYSTYRGWNLAELSLFFARYIVGEFDEAVRNNIGAMRVYVALQAYTITRKADIRRIERERESKEYLQRWAENNAKAVTREEYLKSLANEQAV